MSAWLRLAVYPAGKVDPRKVAPITYEKPCDRQVAPVIGDRVELWAQGPQWQVVNRLWLADGWLLVNLMTAKMTGPQEEIENWAGGMVAWPTERGYLGASLTERGWRLMETAL